MPQNKNRAQLLRVFAIMKDGLPRTLDQIGRIAGCPPQSASARLRDYRKVKFGSHLVEKKLIAKGVYAYTLTQSGQPLP